MRFLMTVNGGGRPPDKELLAEIGRFVEELTRAGVLLATGGLDRGPHRHSVSGAWLADAVSGGGTEPRGRGGDGVRPRAWPGDRGQPGRGTRADRLPPPAQCPRRPLAKLGRRDEAAAEFRRAASLTKNIAERTVLLRRATGCSAPSQQTPASARQVQSDNGPGGPTGASIPPNRLPHSWRAMATHITRLSLKRYSAGTSSGSCGRGTEGHGGARLRGEDGVEERGGFCARRTVADLPVAELDDPPRPVGAKGQFGGDERQAEGADQRGDGF